MKLIIEISEETKKNIHWYGLHLCPRDENNLVNAIRNGQPLPEDCEILTKEAYSDLCKRASKGTEHGNDD